jgi:hypothetical protein
MHDVTWIASAMTDEDRAVAAEAGGDAIDETARDGSRYRLKLVVHDRTAYDWYYNVVSNPTLWFLQHYLWNLAQAPNIDRGLHHAWDEGYVTVNAGFAEAVVAELQAEPGSPVFFHDSSTWCRDSCGRGCPRPRLHCIRRSLTTGVFPRRSARPRRSWRTVTVSPDHWRNFLSGHPAPRHFRCPPSMTTADSRDKPFDLRRFCGVRIICR